MSPWDNSVPCTIGVFDLIILALGTLEVLIKYGPINKLHLVTTIITWYNGIIDVILFVVNIEVTNVIVMGIKIHSWGYHIVVCCNLSCSYKGGVHLGGTTFVQNGGLTNDDYQLTIILMNYINSMYLFNAMLLVQVAPIIHYIRTFLF
jgi:hypothetical protein